MTTPTVTIYQTTTQKNTQPHCWANEWAATGIVEQYPNRTTLQLPHDSANKCNLKIVNLGTERAWHKISPIETKAQSRTDGAERTQQIDLTDDVTLTLWRNESRTSGTGDVTLTLTKSAPQLG